MLLAIEGEEGCGKTTLAYTAPRRLVGFAFDMGVERALYGGKHGELFKDTKIQIVPYGKDPTMAPSWDGYDLTVYELPQPIQLDTILVIGAKELWDYFLFLLVKALKDDGVRSIVVDTMTVARRVKADAYLEGLQANPQAGRPPRERLLQIEWGATNDAIRGIYTTLAGVKKNLVAVHHLTDERKETIDSAGKVVQSLTGQRILEGLSQTYRFVDVAIRNEKLKWTDEKDPKVQTVFRKCGYNLGMEGFAIANPTWDLLSQVIEDTLGGSLKLERTNG